jgi:hypothetical protein
LPCEAGKLIPLFEIEKITELVRSSGETGIVGSIGPDATVNRMFMKTILNSRAQP